MHFDLWVPGKPKTKGRPRFTKSGRTYTPKETLAEEARIAQAYREADGPLFLGAVTVDVTYYTDGQWIALNDHQDASPLRGDIDNYLKLTLDALQGDECPAFANDKAVVQLRGLKRAARG